MARKRDSEEAAAVVGVCDMTGVAGAEELINYDMDDIQMRAQSAHCLIRPSWIVHPWSGPKDVGDRRWKRGRDDRREDRRADRQTP